MTVDAPALACSGPVHVYRVSGTDVAALRGVDLTVQPGQRVALLGRSGSGKSTLLSIVAGIFRPSAGRAEIFGEDLAQISRARLRSLRGEGLGLVLQGAATNLVLFDDAVGNIDHVTRGRRAATVASASPCSMPRASGICAPRWVRSRRPSSRWWRSRSR